MNVLDAAHLIAHEYPGGAPALALRMGCKSQKVFDGKVNPNDLSHVLGLVESVRMQQLSGRADILYAMADALDHVCLKKPDMANEEINEAVSRTCIEFGEFIQSVTGSLKDKRVTRSEAKAMQKELAEMIAAATTLHSAVSALAERKL